MSYCCYSGRPSGLMVCAFVPGASGPGSSPDRGRCVVFVGKTLTLTVTLSTQEYKWVMANCWGNLTNCGEVTCDGLASPPGGVEILLAASCYGRWDKLRQREPASLGFKASLHFTVAMVTECDKNNNNVLTVIRQFFETNIVASIDDKW